MIWDMNGKVGQRGRGPLETSGLASEACNPGPSYTGSLGGWQMLRANRQQQTRQAQTRCGILYIYWRRCSPSCVPFGRGSSSLPSPQSTAHTWTSLASSGGPQDVRPRPLLSQCTGTPPHRFRHSHVPTCVPAFAFKLYTWTHAAACQGCVCFF